jgi:hypothetical protein
MARFAVILHVRGPFKEASSADVHDGAYTCRFVSAENSDGACVAAVEALRSEPRFQCFRTVDGSPRIEIDQARSADDFEGRRGVLAYVFYDESSADAAKVKVLKPRCQG